MRRIIRAAMAGMLIVTGTACSRNRIETTSMSSAGVAALRTFTVLPTPKRVDGQRRLGCYREPSCSTS